MENDDTMTLEWLLEKDYDCQFSTMCDNEKLNFIDIVENGKELNDIGNNNTEVIDKADFNLLSTGAEGFEQRKINIKNRKLSDDINKSLSNVYVKPIKFNRTFYKNIYEYHGFVESVDKINQKFTAVLKNTEDDEDVLSAEFNLSDIGYESDKNLIEAGVNIVWMIGQEQQLITRNGVWGQGTQQNISKFIIRRPLGLNNKKREEANEKARKFAEFFRQFESEDITD